MRNTCVVFAVLAIALFAGAAPAETIFHYSFDTDYSDSSGNGFHGVAADGNGNGNTDGVSITNAAGEYIFGGGAASFTDERDFVSIPQQLIGSGNPYTISFWARDLSDNGAGGMVMGQTASNPSWFFLWHWDTYFRWRGSGTVAERQADFTIVRDNAWHHWALIAGDADGDGLVKEMTLYRDGDLVGTDSGNLTGMIVDAIGEGYAGTSNFDWEGQIDEVWMFNTALSAAEVRSLRNTNVIPEPAGVALLLCGLLSLAGLRKAPVR